jgi:hypothetical protein
MVNNVLPVTTPCCVRENFCRGGFRLSCPMHLVTEITTLFTLKCSIGSRNPPDLTREDPLNASSALYSPLKGNVVVD